MRFGENLFLFFWPSGLELLKLLPVEKERTVERRTGTRKEVVTVSAVRSSMKACQRYNFLVARYFFFLILSFYI